MLETVALGPDRRFLFIRIVPELVRGGPSVEPRPFARWRFKRFVSLPGVRLQCRLHRTAV